MADFEFESLVLSFEVQLPLALEDLAAGKQAQFEALLRELYPRGRAWSIDPASVTYQVLRAMAATFIEVEVQVERFRRETDPTSTLQLLADWERALGLPDPCLGTSADEEARRAAVVSVLSGLAGASTGEILSFLASLGYAVTLEHFEPFKAGSAGAGDPLYGIAWQFVFGVNYWGAGDRTRLACALSHRLPAHVVAVFYFGEFTPQDLDLEFVVPPFESIV